MKVSIKLEMKSVNSNSLANKINETISALINELFEQGSMNSWHSRSWFIMQAEHELQIVADNNEIVQMDVAYDSRNNSHQDISNGIQHIDIYYKQFDCVNTTCLLYTITDQRNESA